MKVLIVEDDAETAAYVINGFAKYGHVVDHVANGSEGFFVATTGSYDVAIVDCMLPKLDGLSLVKRLREKGNRTPVLFLIDLGGIDDRVEGFKAGGDDYLVKPFAFSELLARVDALAYCPEITAAMTILRCGNLEIDLLKRSVRRGGREINVLPQEFRLLEFLARRAGHVVTRMMLLEMVWDFHFDPKTNIVETHIRRLQSKVDHGFECELIQMVQGAGYMLRAQRSGLERN